MDSQLSNSILKWRSLNLKKELILEIDQLIEKNHISELKDRFEKIIEFGTAGLRGKMAAGLNRINEYTIARISLALARVIKLQKKSSYKIIIAYDTRNYSKEFADITANIFLSENFEVIFFKTPTPTPLVSFAVKYFKADSGVMITASHNPKEYNGYKVFSSSGGQILSSQVDAVILEMKNIEQIDITPPKTKSVHPPKEFFNDYYQKIKKYLLYPKNNNLKILYTPLFGAGRDYVKTLFHKHLKISIDILKSQSVFNGNFPGLEIPNPEYYSVYEKAIKKSKKLHYDLILSTDPDADRIGVLAYHEKEFHFINGNEIGIIMSHFLLSHHENPKSHYIASSVVSTDMIEKICHHFGAYYKKTLTGFKYIAQLIEKDPSNYLLGFEESHGYLIGPYCQDKDAISALGLISQIAQYKKEENKTLIDYLDDIYYEYGFYKSCVFSIYYDPSQSYKIRKIMDYFYDHHLFLFDQFQPGEDLKIEKKIDFKNQILIDFKNNGEQVPFKDYTQTDLIIIYLEDQTKIAIRPSGTESSIKIYIEMQVDYQNYTNKIKKNLIYELSKYEDIIKANLSKM